MADEVEKFVLQYNVELKDSIDKLNQLHEKMEQTKNKAKDAPSHVSNAFKTTLGHVDTLVPGVEKVVSGGKKVTDTLKSWGPNVGAAVEKAKDASPAINRILSSGTAVTENIKSWAPGIVVATAAMMGLAYAVRQVNAMRNEYNEQRQTAWQVGMSPIGVEQTQRELNASSEGRLDPAQARNLMSSVQSKLQDAYTNPNPASQTSLALQMAGTSAYGQNGQIKSVTTALDEIGNKMRHVSQEQANAIGQTLGLTQNETMAIRNRNEAIIESQRLSAAETRRRVESNAAMESLNSSFGTIDESFRRTGNIIAEEFMPVFAEVMKAISDWLSGLPSNVDKAISAFSLFNETFSLFMQDIQDPRKLFTGQASWEKEQKRAADIIAKQNEVAQAAADKQATAAQTQKENAANNEKAIKLFSQSVSSMAGVVDEQQAWAAWAGSVGKAGGLKGLGEGPAGVAQDSGGADGNKFGGYTSPPPGPGASERYNTGNIRSVNGGFREFNSYGEGMLAQGSQLLRYANGKTTGRKLQSINEIIPTWAPSNENATPEYVKFMSQKMNVSPNARLDFKDPKVLGEFMYYQALFEKGSKALAGISESQFVVAARMAQQGKSVDPRSIGADKPDIREAYSDKSSVSTQQGKESGDQLPVQNTNPITTQQDGNKDSYLPSDKPIQKEEGPIVRLEMPEQEREHVNEETPKSEFTHTERTFNNERTIEREIQTERAGNTIDTSHSPEQGQDSSQFTPKAEFEIKTPLGEQPESRVQSERSIGPTTNHSIVDNSRNFTTTNHTTNNPVEYRNSSPEYKATIPAMSSVYSSEGNSMYADSRANVRLQEVFQSVASVIGGGMTVGQMRNGGAAKSDIQWGLNKDMFDTERSIQTLKMQLQGPQLLKNQAQYQTDLLRAEQHLQALRTNYRTVLGTGQGSANGPRQITIQRPTYIINVNGQAQPLATASAVRDALSDHNQTLVNNTNSGVSH